ncbi:MAG: hypothetical protein DMD58_06700 [Gemmatimonadetes bacterium]|nr:MAG: hypothetical protein DMD58_06700 [Gemmatimonadota bacterium]
MRPLVVLAPVLLIIGACTHQVAPKVTPTKIAAVQPPIQARALMLITPSFEDYTTTSSQGFHKFNYHMGTSAALALTDMVKASFTSAEVRRVGDADLMQWLSGPADTSVADLLLVPRFDAGATGQGVFTVSSDVRIRLDVRPYRSATTYSWSSTGHTSRALSSHRGLAGNSLEQALNGLSDSLSAYRAHLEVKP